MIRRALLLASIPVFLAGCRSPRVPSHGGATARATLSRADYRWQTREADGIHLHYLPGSYAAAHAPELARAAETALLHDLALGGMRPPAAGHWLSEGVATWAAGACQGHTVDEIAAGFLRDGTLPPLRDLSARFRGYDELHGYVTAASVVAFVARRGAQPAVQALWRAPAPPGAHPLGVDGETMEAEWRRRLASVPPARLDTASLRQHGCETP